MPAHSALGSYRRVDDIGAQARLPSCRWNASYEDSSAVTHAVPSTNTADYTTNAMPPPAQTQPIWQYSASQQVQYYLDTARNEYVFRDGRRIPISAIPVPRTIPSEPVSIRAAQAQVRQSASTAPASTSMSVRYSTGRAVTEQSDDEDSDNDDSDEAPESEKERPDIPTAYDPQRKAHDRRTTSSKAQPSLPLRSKHQGQPSTQSQTAVDFDYPPSTRPSRDN
ncbi:hypothetical protein LTR22_014049 [Elasticomyces elasticus]|nr:hypothetical protein LTR22_014049 [Elasticomyces elasticus]